MLLTTKLKGRSLSNFCITLHIQNPITLKHTFLLQSRDYVRILIPGALVIDCLFLFLFSFLNPQFRGGVKPPHPPSNVVPADSAQVTFLYNLGTSEKNTESKTDVGD